MSLETSSSLQLVKAFEDDTRRRNWQQHSKTQTLLSCFELMYFEFAEQVKQINRLLWPKVVSID